MKNLSNLSKEKKSSYKEYFGMKADILVCGSCGNTNEKDECPSCGQYGSNIYKSIYDKNKMDEFTTDLYDNKYPEENEQI